jgi:hippurate hydrolase
MPPRTRFEEMQPEIAAWRRDLHQHPELLFETHRTAALVAEKLRLWGCDEVATGVGRTGVVGVIRGRGAGADSGAGAGAGSGSGRVVALRADMDALPIDEATGAPWSSRRPGVMHACGHDGHTAMLLGAARHLCATREFDGTALVVFQPAEESGGGGLAMVEDGLMERWGVTEIYALHNWPGRPLGSFAIRPGPFFAATDQFEIVVEGRGGHAARPQETVDPIVAAAQMVMALQTVASRNADPVEQIVVSVTAVESSSKAFNVIPARVTLRGTVRTLSDALRDLAQDRIPAIARATAQALGAEAQVEWRRGYPVMVNHQAETEHARAVAIALAGACDEAPLVMGGEDFAYMLAQRPGAYILLGNGDSAPVHHPAYDFNDAAIPWGCAWLVGMVEARMPLS